MAQQTPEFIDSKKIFTGRYLAYMAEKWQMHFVLTESLLTYELTEMTAEHEKGSKKMPILNRAREYLGLAPEPRPTFATPTVARETPAMGVPRPPEA